MSNYRARQRARRAENNVAAVRERVGILDLPGFTKAAQQALHNDAFQEWFQREATVGLRDTPLMRQPQQQMGGARK